MAKKTKRATSSNQPISRWFMKGAASLSIVFLVALIPLLIYCKNIFSDLEIQKKSQHMNFGISQLETTVYTVNSVPESLRQDTRFLPFYYLNPDTPDIPLLTGIHMQRHISNVFLPLSLVTDWGLSFSDRMAVTSDRYVSVSDASTYYYDAFQVDDLTYDEWKSLLQQHKARFMPVHQIYTMKSEYDALVYSIPWTKDSYLYVCLNIQDLKRSMVGTSDTTDFYISFEDQDGLCLYTDLPDNASDCHLVTQECLGGSLVITVHIPNNMLAKQITPLYSFLGIYLVICIAVVLGSAVISSRVSAKPVIDTIRSYESNLETFQKAIDEQSKVIQARYMEKAIHGSLATESDYDLFFSYFPQFPQHYHMIYVGLIEASVPDGTKYAGVMSIIQHYLEQCAPAAYMQQLTQMSMLIIVDTHTYDKYVSIVNQLIDNINREEPCYHMWGIASKSYDHPRSLPLAYQQIQNLRSRISPESLNQLCIVSDYRPTEKNEFQMSDVLSLYSAITNGNDEVALMKLDNYSSQLNLHNYAVFEMLRSVLLCIKQEFPEQLMDIEIPFYHAQTDLFLSLSQAIQLFCDKFRDYKDGKTSDSFAQQVKAYIDLHYTEESLCNTTLEEHFNCSYVKIRKAFAQEIGTPISAYIEEKRMEYANELLFRGEVSVTEVAAKCGYTSYNTFHKAYRRVFGHAPTAVKRDT